MSWLRPLFLAATLVLLSACAGMGAGSRSETLVIEESPNLYFLTVPVSRLALGIPRGGWVRSTSGGSDSPRYFHFENGDTNTILTGWFEPAESFKGLAGFWQSETAGWKKQRLPEPRNTRFERVGNWQVIAYDLAIDKTGRISNCHLRAEWVQAGTWLDVHLSVTSLQSPAQNRKKLETILGGLLVSGIPATATT